MKLDIQRFADGKVVIDTELNRKNFENGLDKMKSSTQKAGSTIKNIVASLGITKMIGIAMNTINQSIDGAITRLDTLNQFPKVMSNLGIGAEDAQKSISKMSDKLAGLPTTLDDGARAVQRFTSKNGNVAKSTDLFLALNNAILAGGASAEIQASALEQLSQSYAKGKPDMMEWRTAMTAMPAQLKQVAQAMGYIDADELGQALREGAVSMDEFMDTIVRLNTEGVEGFLSFEEQAKNSTGGIQTAIVVAKTQVVKGVTDIIEALNTKLGDVGLGGLGDVISNIGKKAKEGLDSIAKLITGELSINDFITAGINSITGYINGFSSKLPEIMKNVTNIIKEIADALINNLPNIVESGKLLITNFIIGLKENLPTLLKSAIDIILSLVETIIDNLDFIAESGLEIILTLTDSIFQSLPKLLDKLPDLIIKLCEKLTDIETMIRLQGVALEIVKALVKGMITFNFKMAEAGIKLIAGLVSALKDRIFKTNWGEIGLNIVRGIGNGITNGISWIKNRIKDFVGNVTSFIKKMFKIGSPSKLMRDEIGIYLAQGIGVGFEDEIDGVYKSMQDAINFEQEKLQANVETGKVFNTLQNSTPIAIDINAPVELDGTKVGRLLTPVVSKTIKTGGGV